MHWTPANYALLERIAEEVWDLPLRGKQRMYELERRWSLAYPQRPSRAAALLRQLQLIKARQAQPQEVSPPLWCTIWYTIVCSFAGACWGPDTGGTGCTHRAGPEWSLWIPGGPSWRHSTRPCIIQGGIALTPDPAFVVELWIPACWRRLMTCWWTRGKGDPSLPSRQPDYGA